MGQLIVDTRHPAGQPAPRWTQADVARTKGTGTAVGDAAQHPVTFWKTTLAVSAVACKSDARRMGAEKANEWRMSNSQA